jgi:hypothetical protein
LVGAINENKGRIDTNTTDIGDKTVLNTTEKSNLVGAVNEVSSQLASNTSRLLLTAINAKYPPLPLVGAVGDGVTDDTSALQSIINYTYENKMKLFLPKGDYLISAPLIIYGTQFDNSGTNTIIFGSGRDITNIIKNTNTTSTLSDYTDIDAIFIIGNELTKSNTAITSIWSNQSISKYVHISDLTLKSTASTRVSYGIYSYGLMFARFINLGFHNMNTGIESSRYASFDLFENIEFNLLLNGFVSWSDSSGATTLMFKDCHLNGVNVYGYKIKGNVTFINCSNDGGALVAYYLYASRATLLNCHSESPASSGVLRVIGSTVWSKSRITMINCSIQRPLSTTNPTLWLEAYSTLHIIDPKIVTIEYDALPTTPQGKLYQCSADSRIIWDNPYFTGNDYATYTPVQLADTEKKVVTDRHHLSVTKHTYMAYVSSSVLAEDRNTSTVVEDTTNNQIIFTMSGATGNGYQGLVFDDQLKFDNYSRLYLMCDIDFINTTGNTLDIRLTSDARTGVNTSATIYNTFIKKGTYQYDTTNYELWVDISDVYGTGYVELVLTNLGTVKIKEIALFR